MKTLILTAFIILAQLTSYANTTYGSIVIQSGTSEFRELEIPAGKVLETLHFTALNSDGDIVADNNGFLVPVVYFYSKDVNALGLPIKTAGMKSIQLFGPSKIKISSKKQSILFAYKLRDIEDQSTTPTASVVIPSDATGPVEVILESSTDLITWTAANPGTYASSTSKRFFRVRTVLK